MTAREKVVNVETQIRAMLAGEQTDFTCPYCNADTTEGNGILCCNEAADVINVILDHIEHLEQVALVDQVFNQVQKHFGASESRISMN